MTKTFTDEAKERMLELTASREGLEDEYAHLVRTADGWRIIDALWRPQ